MVGNGHYLSDNSAMGQKRTYALHTTGCTGRKEIRKRDGALYIGITGDLINIYIEGITHKIASFLQMKYPKASRQRCWNVAYGIVGICFKEESLAPYEIGSKVQ